MKFSRFLLHGENEMWWYTLLEAVAWSWGHSAQFCIKYFTKIIFLLLHWMSYMLYTSPGRGQSKVARAQDLQGKRKKTCSSHTIISISAINVYNNVNFSLSHVESCLVFSVVHGSSSTQNQQWKLGSYPSQLYQPLTAAPSACAHYLDLPMTQVQPNLGPYQSFHSISAPTIHTISIIWILYWYITIIHFLYHNLLLLRYLPVVFTQILIIKYHTAGKYIVWYIPEW